MRRTVSPGATRHPWGSSTHVRRRSIEARRSTSRPVQPSRWASLPMRRPSRCGSIPSSRSTGSKCGLPKLRGHRTMLPPKSRWSALGRVTGGSPASWSTTSTRAFPWFGHPDYRRHSQGGNHRLAATVCLKPARLAATGQRGLVRESRRVGPLPPHDRPHTRRQRFDSSRLLDRSARGGRLSACDPPPRQSGVRGSLATSVTLGAGLAW